MSRYDLFTKKKICIEVYDYCYNIGSISEQESLGQIYDSNGY